MYRESNPETGRDVLIRPTDGGSPARPLLASAFDEHSAVISPDGQWIAFVSNETGRDEIQVTTFPEPGGRWQISNEGGTEPIWSPDGSEIFYRDGNAMVVVQITRKPEFRVLDRELLFARNYFAYRYHQQYDVSADGQGFLLIKQPDDLDEAYGFPVVINWLEELRRTLDTQK